MPGHLIHVGLPKAGSTALGAWFAAHPSLDYAPNAIAGFYDAFDIGALAAGVEDPRPWRVTSSEAFTSPRVSDDPRIDGTPHPMRPAPLRQARERVCHGLHALFGDATILIVTRGFRGLTLSAYSQYVKNGGGLSPGELLGAADNPVQIAEEGYDHLVGLYEAAFGPTNVIVLPYELLRDDPQRFVRALEARLGLPPVDAPVQARNVALAGPELVWHRRLSLVVRAVARALPRRAGDALFAGYVGLLRRDRLRRPVALVTRLAPGGGDGGPDVPAEVLERLRGRASTLADRPFYEPYAAEYLNDGGR